MELIDRIVGTDDPDLLRLLRAAKAGKPGRPKKGEEKGSDSEPIKTGRTESTDYTADRLAREAPAEYAAVQSGEKTINRAALDAGHDESAPAHREVSGGVVLCGATCRGAAGRRPRPP